MPAVMTAEGTRTELGSIRAVIWTSIPFGAETDTCAAAGTVAVISRKRESALLWGIAVPFDSYAHGIDGLETPQVQGGAERYRTWLAIPHDENGEPYEG